MPSSRGSSWPRDQTHVPPPPRRLLHCRLILYHWATREACYCPRGLVKGSSVPIDDVVFSRLSSGIFFCLQFLLKKKKRFIYLFFAGLGLCCVCRLSLVAMNRGYSSWQYTSFSLWWLLFLQSVDSRTQAQYLWHTGLVTLRHVGSSWTRDRTCVPCTGRQILNHWAIREVLWFLHLQHTCMLDWVQKCLQVFTTPGIHNFAIWPWSFSDQEGKVCFSTPTHTQQQK